MNRQEVIKVVATKTGFFKKDVTAIFDAIDEAVIAGLKKDGKVKPISGVTFETKVVEEHEARNPQNGEKVIVPKKKKVSTKISDGFKAAINE